MVGSKVKNIEIMDVLVLWTYGYISPLDLHVYQSFGSMNIPTDLWSKAGLTPTNNHGRLGDTSENDNLSNDTFIKVILYNKNNCHR